MIWIKIKIDNMGFKLGTERGNYAVSGEIKTKFRCHKESGDPDISVAGTPIIRKRWAPGIMDEENDDGSRNMSKQMKKI